MRAGSGGITSLRSEDGRLRRDYRDNMLRLTAAVTGHFPEGTRITRPTGGYVLWVELPEHIDSVDLSERAAEAGVCVAPGVLFSPTRRCRNFIRLNAGLCWTPRVEGAVKTVARLASAWRP